MNITILNGSQEHSSFDRYLEAIQVKLESSGHTVTCLELREIDLRYCTGCFGCWVKTPGECSIQDQSDQIRREVIRSDFTLWAAPLRMGFPTELLKRALDKSIPLLHPYFDVVNGEAHHKPRYDHYPRLGLLVSPEEDTDAVDLEIIARTFSRTALNMKKGLEFSLDTGTAPEEVVERILGGAGTSVPYPEDLGPTKGVQISPPQKLLLFNGSPRGRKGNTPIMLTQFGEGFSGVPGHSFQLLHLNRINSLEEQVKAFAEAECVWVGFPLYTDAMPALVKRFIEALETFRDRPGNPPMGFLVQSGFPEALHSRYVERYLEKLVERMGAPYAGTIVKGGGEGIRMMPDAVNRRLFTVLRGLGRGLAASGELDRDLLAQVAGRERYPSWMVPVMKTLVNVPLYQWYWNSQLKENEVFEDRFARPCQES